MRSAPLTEWCYHLFSMGKQDQAQIGDVVGTIRHRLLVNQIADPAEVSSHLPDGIRPHVVPDSGGVIVGCCLIAIDSIRPWPAPAAVGTSIRAAAHRISVDVGPVASPTRAVYVPCRHTDGILPGMAGGRVYPGVHRRAEIEVAVDAGKVAWSVKGRETRTQASERGGFDISVSADRTTAIQAVSEVADVVIGTKLGLSPGLRSGSIEAADMCLDDLSAQRVDLIELRSDFLDSFSTARPTDTLLMTDVDVVWKRQSAPAADGAHEAS